MWAQNLEMPNPSASILALVALAAATPPPPTDLLVNGVASPLGLDLRDGARLRFSWALGVSAGARGVTQAAYEIEVAAAGSGALLWGSGKVASNAPSSSPRPRASRRARHRARLRRAVVDDGAAAPSAWANGTFVGSPARRPLARAAPSGSARRPRRRGRAARARTWLRATPRWGRSRRRARGAPRRGRGLVRSTLDGARIDDHVMGATTTSGTGSTTRRTTPRCRASAARGAAGRAGRRIPCSLAPPLGLVATRATASARRCARRARRAARRAARAADAAHADGAAPRCRRRARRGGRSATRPRRSPTLRRRELQPPRAAPARAARRRADDAALCTRARTAPTSARRSRRRSSRPRTRSRRSGRCGARRGRRVPSPTATARSSSTSGRT